MKLYGIELKPRELTKANPLPPSRKEFLEAMERVLKAHAKTLDALSKR